MATEASPLQAGDYFIRASASVVETNSHASFDFKLTLVDPCRYENLKSPDLPAKIAYDIGIDDELLIKAGLFNLLCPKEQP